MHVMGGQVPSFRLQLVNGGKELLLPHGTCAEYEELTSPPPHARNVK
jgi:hypothetical protein